MKPVSLPPVVTAPHRSAIYDEGILEKMVDNMGEWFLIENRPTRPSLSWAKQKIEGLQIATRRSPEGGFDVYARIRRPVAE